MSKESVSKKDKGAESSRNRESEQASTDSLDAVIGESPSKMILRMQQTRGNAFVRRMLEQTAKQGGGRANWLQRVQIRMDSGRSVGDGAAENIREEVLRVMDALHTLWSLTNAEYSQDYGAIGALAAGATVPATLLIRLQTGLTRNDEPHIAPPVAQNFLGQPLLAGVGRGQTNNAVDVLKVQNGLYGDYLNPSAFNIERMVINTYLTGLGAVLGPTAALLPLPESLFPQTLLALTQAKRAIASGTFRRDAMAGTRPVTTNEHNAIEVILNPGSTLAPLTPPATTPPASGSGSTGGTGSSSSGSSSGSTTGSTSTSTSTGSTGTSTTTTTTPPPPPPTRVVGPPVMTGAGAGGALERDMLAALTPAVQGWANTQRTQAATVAAGGGTNMLTLAQTMSTSAQSEVERVFGSYIQVASRGAGDEYHPGSYSLSSSVADSTTRRITPGFRLGWTGYWMTLGTLGQPVLDRYHCVRSRPGSSPTTPSPDQVEFDRIAALFVSRNQADIDEAIHGWPAEATDLDNRGRVFINPFRDFHGNQDAEIRERWDIFTILIHEFLHKVTHPNYRATADAIGGTARKILMEGMTEVMRHIVWADLQPRLGSPTFATLRQQVEGASHTFNPALVQYHGDYGEIAQAQQIVAQVGIENAKAAYFMGHTELIGLGENTSSSSPLTNIGNYHQSDEGDANIYTAIAGDTLASIQTRTNAPGSSIVDASSGTPLATGASVSAGTRLRIPGIRWIRAIQNDTLGTLANQNHVSLPAIATANNMPEDPARAIAPDTRILIPIH